MGDCHHQTSGVFKLSEFCEYLGWISTEVAAWLLASVDFPALSWLTTRWHYSLTTGLSMVWTNSQSCVLLLKAVPADSMNECRTPSSSDAAWGPVWRQVAAHRPDQQHHLRAVNGVPHEGGEQEEMEESRHHRARDAIWCHVFVRLGDFIILDVGFVLGVVVSVGVLDSREEGDDEGQQADTDAEQSHLWVPVLSVSVKKRFKGVKSLFNVEPEHQRPLPQVFL